MLLPQRENGQIVVTVATSATAGARVLLVETGGRVLAGFPRSLSARAALALEGLEVTPLV